MRQSFKSLCICYAVLCGLVPVKAEVPLDSLQRIDEVIVTASAVLKEVVPVQQLSGTQLERLGSHSVADALRYFSGVQIKDYGGVGGLKTVNIRSMGTNHVGVFYDGVELGNAQNGTVDLGRFSLDNMEAVTLYNGQKSAIFQPAKDFGSAGSIYLRSRTPVFDGDEKFHVKATLKGGSFHLVNPSMLWEQKLTERLSGSLSAEYMYTSGKYRFTYRVNDAYDTTAVRRNGDVNAVRVEGGLHGRLDGGYWKAKAYFYNSERGYPGAVVKNKFSHEDRQWDTDVFVQGSLKKDFRNWYSFLLNGKYAYNYLHYLADPRKDEALMYVDNKYRQQEVYLSAANRFTVFPFWELALSADYLFNQLDADLRDFAWPRRHTGLVAAATALHFEQFKLQASVLGTFVHDIVVTGEKTDNRMEWTPTVIASYRPFKAVDFNVRAFYKRIFRMPTLNDLYYTFIGNADLDPEYTNQYDVGATYSAVWGNSWFRGIEVQADAYYNNVENKIVAVPASNFFRWTMLNLGLVKILGTDVAVRTDFCWGQDWNLRMRFNYTFQKARDHTDPSSQYYRGQIPYIPVHSGSAAVSLTWRTWETDYSFIYTGERYSSVANIPQNYVLPWYTSDFSMAKRFPLKKGELKFTLEINNIFNQQYEVVLCYPMPGINFKGILQYSF